MHNKAQGVDRQKRVRVIGLELISTVVIALSWLAGCDSTTPDPALDADSGTGKSVAQDVTSVTEKVSTVIEFVEQSRANGIDFTYRNGEEAGHFSIVESLGGGLGLFDFNSDGLLDLIAPGGGKFEAGPKIVGLPPALFQNDGNWKFHEVSNEANVARAAFYSHGVAVGDHDNDGFPDFVITGYGGLVFYRNLGDGTFEELTQVAGLTDSLWSSSAAWGDIDGDGLLDLYVAHYANWSWQNHPFCPGPRENLREVCAPRNFDPLPDILYLNNGDGTFRDGSRAAGLSLEGKGLGVVLADVDLDGKLDIYVANDTVPNLLYKNLGDGKLSEVGMRSGASGSATGTADGSMGADLGDFNLDGLPDIWVVNFAPEAFALYRNEGNFLFTHVSQSYGVTAMGGLYVGWGTVFSDFDRDGDEDIFVSNGHVIRYPLDAPLLQKPLVLENDRGKRFANVAPAAGKYADTPHMGRGAALGDIDNDGDLDLAVNHTNEPVALLSNESQTQNGWVSLRLIGTRSSRDPVGAIVRVETSKGAQVRQLKGGTSYASSSDPRLFFGLGKSEIREITIRWPSGQTQTLKGVAVKQTLTIIEPTND